MSEWTPSDVFWLIVCLLVVASCMGLLDDRR